jgi:hypothetical protein
VLGWVVLIAICNYNDDDDDDYGTVKDKMAIGSLYFIMNRAIKAD